MTPNHMKTFETRAEEALHMLLLSLIRPAGHHGSHIAFDVHP